MKGQSYTLNFRYGVDSMTDRLEQLEKQMIRDAINSAKGNKSQAARNLGVNRTTLCEKRRRYGMVVAEPSNPKVEPRVV